jgi:hypothetical protein
MNPEKPTCAATDSLPNSRQDPQFAIADSLEFKPGVAAGDQDKSMKVEQTQWVAQKGWTSVQPSKLGAKATLVFLFGSRPVLRQNDLFQQIRGAYPNAQMFGCSTAGEIQGSRVFDDSLVVTAISLENTRAQGASCKISSTADSRAVGQRLAQSIVEDGLAHVLVLSDGVAVNGSELVLGLAEFLPPGIAVTGGLSADGAHFQETLVLFNAPAERDTVAVLGFYGDKLKVGYGSLGGWDQFGPERLITKSDGNVLYELDGKSALELYKKYLGDQAKELPASALLFPLSIRGADGEAPLVRTILGINEKEQSMTFAGEVPAGATARLMKANFDRLIEGAAGAARATCATGMKGSAPDLALLISCVGRKLILRQRIEEEVEAVQEVLGAQTPLLGFYSYGEISPFAHNSRCELHNQTMTITTFTEAEACA